MITHTASEDLDLNAPKILKRPEDSRPLTGTVFMFNNLGCSSFKIPDGFHSLIKFLHVGLLLLYAPDDSQCNYECCN